MKKLIIFSLALAIIAISPISALSEKTYKVYVERVADNIYRDRNSGVTIKTSLCLELSLGDEAILVWDYPIGSEIYSGGKLIFLRSGATCQVDAVF